MPAIELEEVQMVEVSDDAMETTAEGSKWSGFAGTGCTQVAGFY